MFGNLVCPGGLFFPQNVGPPPKILVCPLCNGRDRQCSRCRKSEKTCAHLASIELMSTVCAALPVMDQK